MTTPDDLDREIERLEQTFESYPASALEALRQARDRILDLTEALGKAQEQALDAKEAAEEYKELLRREGNISIAQTDRAERAEAELAEVRVARQSLDIQLLRVTAERDALRAVVEAAEAWSLEARGIRSLTPGEEALYAALAAPDDALEGEKDG